MDKKVYEFESLIYDAGKSGGAYVVFPYNIKEEFGKGRVKVHVTFDGEPYDGSIVNMGVKDADGRICYIIGIRKDIRARIKKQVGDMVAVTVVERAVDKVELFCKFFAGRDSGRGGWHILASPS